AVRGVGECYLMTLIECQAREVDVKNKSLSRTPLRHEKLSVLGLAHRGGADASRATREFSARSSSRGVTPRFAFDGEQLDHEEGDTDDDEAVGEIEVGPLIAAPQTEVEEVHDLAAEHAIDEIPDRTTHDQAERQRRKAIPGGQPALADHDHS